MTTDQISRLWTMVRRPNRYLVAVIVATMLMALSGPAAGAVVTAPAGTALSIAVSPTQVQSAAVVGVSGALTLTSTHAGVPGRTVVLYARQLNESAYRAVSSAVTGTGGRYTFSVRPTWSTAYQVRFAGGSAWGSSASSYRIARVTGWYPLVLVPYYEAWAGDYAGAPLYWRGTAVRIGGVVYQNSVATSDWGHTDDDVVFKVNGHCDRLDTYLGVPDGSPARTVRGYSIGTSTYVLVGNAAVGAPAQHLVVPIAGTKEISIQAGASQLAVVAAPRVHCTW